MTRPRLVYLVTEDWYFMSHRLPMARAARDAGYDVHVATRVDRHGAAIEAEGFHLHSLNLYRGSINPLKFLAAVRGVRRLYRRLQPALVHHIALQPLVVGSLAAFGLAMPQVNSILGFGSVFSAPTVKSRLTRVIFRLILPALLNRNTSLTLVMNPDHRTTLLASGVAPDRVAVFPGSGVDIDRFSPLPEPEPPVTVAYAGRMLEDKGVRTLVAAHETLRRNGETIDLLLAGTPDPANPNSIPAKDLEAWSQMPGLRWIGHVDDVRDVWRAAHIAVLASRAEGLPLSLLEAAACGRAIVATDVPGCREIARAGVNALLVAPDDPDALADAIERLVRDPELRRRFASAGRALVESGYSSERVGREIVAIYHRIMGASAESLRRG